ncbi:MAG: nucleotide pyrophosphohydrolase [Planctomycetota bacterium]|nr:nucleotide pyrophosphohydrolase [Planctomycetota bacterium]MCX8038957.1 nucleotide pyrophosphohydrolase [Planctomycetota bacterium]MDW8372677.1 nucleotide pyrophosphohydrolase [Planctomycetota bacterium]
MPFTPRCLEELRREIAAFAAEREWEQFHTPRNLLLALVSEIGELADLVRWRGDAQPAVADEDRQAWEAELADVGILLVRLADRSGVDLSAAIARKLQEVRQRYPADAYRGSARKAPSGQREAEADQRP